MTALYIALSSLTAALGIALAFIQLRDVAKRPSPAARELPSKIRRLAPEERAKRVAELAEAESWEGALARHLIEAPSPAERADAASESVGDLAGLYASRSRWAPAALRIQVAVGLLSGALLFAQGSRLDAAIALTIAVMGGMVSYLVGDRAKERERAQRALADEIVLLLVPDLTEGRRARKRGY